MREYIYTESVRETYGEECGVCTHVCDLRVENWTDCFFASFVGYMCRNGIVCVLAVVALTLCASPAMAYEMSDYAKGYENPCNDALIQVHLAG